MHQSTKVTFYTLEIKTEYFTSLKHGNIHYFEIVTAFSLLIHLEISGIFNLKSEQNVLSVLTSLIKATMMFSLKF